MSKLCNPPALGPVIRDDRKGTPKVATDRGIDYVLIDCPDCGRSHFVTVDACPTEAEAARETAMATRAA